MRRASRPAFRAAAIGTLLSLGAGCTFLVSFDEVGDADAGLGPLDPNRDGASDSSVATDAGPIPIPITPPCDSTFALSEIRGCETFVEGAQICADNRGITAYPGNRATDVIACSKSQGATCVRHCVACAHLPSGFPDQCDQCIGKADGVYCGTDMGWQPEHFRLLVTCEGERVARAVPCSDRGCDSVSGAGDAVCRP